MEHLDKSKNVVYNEITAEEIENSYAEVDYESTCSGYIELYKTDSLTGKAVANAEYGIYTRVQSTDGDESDICITKVDLVQTLTTDEEGYAISDKLS